MTKQIAGSFIGTVAAGALVLLGAKVIGPLPLSITQTTTNKQSTFDVSGVGEITSAPDRAVVNVGVQATDASVAKVQDKGNQVIAKLTSDLKALGIDAADIKTANYSLYPTYDYQNGNQKITGYSLSINLEIQVKDFSKINTVVDTATKDGANQVGGISFTLSEGKKQDLETQAREQAIAKAKDKANTLSRLAGVKLGRIVNVTENEGVNSPVPRPLMMAKDVATSVGAPMMGVGGGTATVNALPATDVQPGSTTFTMTVTLSYETL